MDEISFVETSSVVDETNISMNVFLGRNEGAPDENILNQTRPLQRRRGLHSSQHTLFKQTRPLLRRPRLHSSQNLHADFHAKIVRPLLRRLGLHSSQITLFKQTCPLLRRPGLHSSQNLDFHANIVRTRRSPREICLDLNGQCICKLSICATPVRGSTVQSMNLSNMSVQSIAVTCATCEFICGLIAFKRWLFKNDLYVNDLEQMNICRAWYLHGYLCAHDSVPYCGMLCNTIGT